MAVEYTQLDLLNKIKQNGYSYRNTYTKKILEVDENVGSLKDNMTTFKKSMKWLKKYTSGATSKTRLEKEVKSLIKSYNGMDKDADSITDKDVQKQMKKLEKLFSDNEENFRKIGIEKVNGKYTIDSKKFDEADEDALSALFEGSNSFINKAEKIMRKAEESAEDAHYSKETRKITSVMEYKESDVTLAKFMILAETTGGALGDYNAAVQSGSLSNDYKSAIMYTLSNFAIASYKIYGGENSGNLEKLNQLCRDNEELLGKVGIVFDDENKKTMSFKPDAGTDDFRDRYMDTEAFRTAYNDLFGSDSEFAKSVREYSRNVYNSVVKPDKIGVSIIDVSV